MQELLPLDFSTHFRDCLVYIVMVIKIVKTMLNLTTRKVSFKGQGNVRKFRTMVNVILNTKKVREMSGNFIIFAQNGF